MTVNNDELKIIFTGFKENIQELKDEFKDYIIEGKKEHKEIKEALRKLCDRMKDAENTIDTHIINTIQQDKSKREKILLVIAIIGSIIGTIGMLSRLFL